MKNVWKLMVAFVVMAIISTGSSFAQSTDMGGNHPQLTEEQLAALEAAKAELDAAKTAFKASLTEEQLAILADATLTRDQRLEALKATLTEAQLALFDAVQTARDAMQALHCERGNRPALTAEEIAAREAAVMQRGIVRDELRVKADGVRLADRRPRPEAALCVPVLHGPQSLADRQARGRRQPHRR